MHWQGRELRRLAPTIFVAANALAFCAVRPDVPDLWAARARAMAAAHGVGLTYWFSWFGGSTPAGYSVLTPTLCALVGTEVVAGIAAVTISAIVTQLVRETPRPVAAAWMASVGIVINLWCGRVPFLVGSAFAIAAIALVRRRRTTPAAGMAVLSALASPVSGAFLVVALAGVLLARRTRAYRSATLLTLACACGALVLLAVLFGTPGPEPFPGYMLAEVAAALGLMLLSGPPDHLRATLAVAAVATIVVFLVPNGLGANLARLALFCLPAAAVALSRRRPATVIVLMTPIVAFGGITSYSAARSATDPSSHASYYRALAAELDALPGVATNRLELVHPGHAAYTALLGHAVLARGWETQQDRALNAELDSSSLDSDRYGAWLHDNAVGYVAIDANGTSPEARLVNEGHPAYLRLIWTHGSWRLYQVARPTPIVSRPAVLESSTQASMTIHVPCRCRTVIRVRWSRFLVVSASMTETPGGAAGPAELTRDDSGWTTLRTDQPGDDLVRGRV